MGRLIGLLVAASLVAGVTYWLRARDATVEWLPEPLRARSSVVSPAPVELEPPPATPGARARLQVCPGDVHPEVLDASAPVDDLIAELWDRTRWVFSAPRRGSEPLRAGLTELFRQGGDAAVALARLQDAPDRVVEGFDFVRAARVTIAARALRHEPAQAAELSRALGDAEPLGAILLALAADRSGNGEERVAWLEEAHRRDPDEPALAARAALARNERGDAVLALSSLNAYARLVPDDPWPSAVRSRWEARARHERELAMVERDGVRLRYGTPWTESDAASAHAVLLRALEDAALLTGTTRRPELTAAVYPTAEMFREATCGPSWSGGLFDGVLHLPPVDDRQVLERRIRHESLHAQLQFAAPGAPVWLHEGLAQHLEGVPTSGLERSLARMQRDRTYVPFPSLEGSFVVIEDAPDARFAYHQSYAMVQALLDRHGPEVIPRAVGYLATEADPTELLGALSQPPLDGDQLLEWVRQR